MYLYLMPATTTAGLRHSWLSFRDLFRMSSERRAVQEEEVLTLIFPFPANQHTLHAVFSCFFFFFFLLLCFPYMNNARHTSANRSQITLHPSIHGNTFPFLTTAHSLTSTTHQQPHDALAYSHSPNSSTPS